MRIKKVKINFDFSEIAVVKMEEIKINKLEGEDGWTLWKFQIKVVLRAGGLWEIVSGALTQPADDGEPKKNVD